MGADRDRPRPLAGRLVVVTRPRRQAPDLAEPLVALGARVLVAPAVSILPPTDPTPLEGALSEIQRYDWIVFTSANGVEEVARRLEAAGRGPEALAAARVAAVGPGTRSALEGRGVSVELVPAVFRVEALVEALVEFESPRGKRFLLPRAEVANRILPKRLREEGGEVTEVVAYRTVPDGEGAAAAREALRRREVSYVTFTSASTARGFVGAVGAHGIREGQPPARIATIGPETSAAVREEGLVVDVEAEDHTVAGLVRALLEDATSSGP